MTDGRTEARQLLTMAAGELEDAQALLQDAVRRGETDPLVLEDLHLALLGPVLSLADAVDILRRSREGEEHRE
ncbi:MAG: hypothetical protein HDQ87_05450 [Clostridia bacterium]|nr:hypothetical protein [Clostridia bacterium]